MGLLKLVCCYQWNTYCNLAKIHLADNLRGKKAPNHSFLQKHPKNWKKDFSRIEAWMSVWWKGETTFPKLPKDVASRRLDSWSSPDLCLYNLGHTILNVIQQVPILSDHSFISYAIFSTHVEMYDLAITLPILLIFNASY